MLSQILDGAVIENPLILFKVTITCRLSAASPAPMPPSLWRTCTSNSNTCTSKSDTYTSRSRCVKTDLTYLASRLVRNQVIFAAGSFFRLLVANFWNEWVRNVFVISIIYSASNQFQSLIPFHLSLLCKPRETSEFQSIIWNGWNVLATV